MFKNGLVKAIALATIVGVAACNNQDEDAVIVEETPATETVAPAPEVAPAPATELEATDTLAAPAGDTAEAPASY